MLSPIDIAIRIQNGYLARKQEVVVRGTKMGASIIEKLIAEGYLESYSVQEDGVKKQFIVTLKYAKDSRVFNGIKIWSKPGKRAYVGVREIPTILNGLGIVIMSTTRGIMSGKEARKAGLGGEVLFSIW